MTKQEQKQGLIEIYQDSLNDEPSEFMRMILTSAIRRLQAGNDPEWVEDWVVEMEKNWRALGKKSTDRDGLTMYVAIGLIAVGVLVYQYLVHQSILGEPYMIMLQILLGTISLFSIFKIITLYVRK